MLPSLVKIVAGEPLGLMAVINSDYSLSYVSPRLSELAGVERKAVSGMFCYQLLGQREEPCEAAEYPCPLRQVLHSGEICTSSQNYLRQDTGGRCFTVDCYPLRDNGNSVVQVLSILRDDTEAHKVQSDVDYLYRLAALGDLFHGLAHNVNTPLSAVLARAEMLRDRLQGIRDGHPDESGGGDDNGAAEKLDKCIRDADVIVANAMKISGIIRNMMNKRLQEEEDTPQMLNLSHLLHEELQFLEANMTFKHEIKKTYHLEESLPLIKGVYYHFSQLFTHVMNTIMKSFDGSDVKELTIKSTYDERAIYIEIHHTGVEANQGIQKGQSQSFDGVWVTQVEDLLKPYNGELRIASKPQDHRYIISIPYGVSG